MSITTETLFRRAWRLTVGDKQFGSIDALRPLAFTFSVQRDKTITPNNANVLIHNLSADTRQELEQLSGGFGQGTGKIGKHTVHSDNANRKHKTKKPTVAVANQDFGVTVRLEAGYGNNVGQIFFGVLRKVSSWREGPTWFTQISGGDSEKSITTAQISKTWARGTRVSSVVRDMVGALKVGKGGLDNTLHALDVTGFLSGGTTLPRPLTAHGDATTELDAIMRSCGLEWSIQDGAFYAGPAGVATFPGTGPLLTPDTGLLDVPQIDRHGNVSGKALLNADLLPGRVFRVESTRVTGDFLCVKTQHVGDSSGADWTVQFIGELPKAGSKLALATGRAAPAAEPTTP